MFCVLGHPVGHSLSPAMHNAVLPALGVDGVYVAFDVPPDGLPAAVRGLQALGCAGVNGTIPHKEALVGLMDELSEDARVIGAVNTIEFRKGRLIGHNTDGAGFLADLEAGGGPSPARHALVLGAGGSARAVAAALARSGARVTVVNRTRVRAQELAGDLNRALGVDTVDTAPQEAEAVSEVAGGCDLLVNTTSLGMWPETSAMPPVPVEALHPGLFVYDLIYNPLETRLLAAARARGCRTRHGAGMLARQGAMSLEIWTGLPVPAEQMEKALLERLTKE